MRVRTAFVFTSKSEFHLYLKFEAIPFITYDILFNIFKYFL